MKPSFLLFFIVASIVLYASVSSCDNDRVSTLANEGPYEQPIVPPEHVTALDPVTPVSYGNGVYYFDATERQFGISLSAFLADTTKQLLSITGDNTIGTGIDQGYWVVVKEK